MTGLASTRTTATVEVSTGVVIAVEACVVGALIAAGSTGVLTQSLQVVLTWIALSVAIVAAWPPPARLPLLALVMATMVLLPAVHTVHPAHGVLAIAAAASLLAAAQVGLARRILLGTALSLAVFAVYRLAHGSIPIVWWLADAAGQSLGSATEAVTGKPLWVGATFGGIDFLVLMTALVASWLLLTPAPRRYRLLFAMAAILLAHLLYLSILSLSADIVEALPVAVPPPEKHPYTPPPWHWASAVQVLFPWNVPALAVIFNAIIIWVMFRWTAWLPTTKNTAAVAGNDFDRGRTPLTRQPLLTWGVVVAAAALPPVMRLSLGRSGMTGKTIVVNEQGYLDWRRPQHGSYGQQAAGMYGMLPTLVESLGGRLSRSSDLSEADLKAADVLMLLNPTQQWTQSQLKRIREYVLSGGSLLLVAGPLVHQGDGPSTHNDVLRSTGMFVRQDVAISQTDGWQQACQVLAHPATASVDDSRNALVSDWGASIRVGVTTRPLLVGQWGWSDPGSDALLTGGGRFEPGEKLGDLVLAAEQPLGNGTVVVLADSSILTNEAIVRSWPFVGRLLNHLAAPACSPQDGWRQALGILLGLMLVASIAWRPTGYRIAAAATVLAVSVAASTSISHRATRVVPQLPEDASSALAYIDASHVEAYSDQAWSFDGIDGLALTLMRNGYLPLCLPELTRERIEHAAMLVSIAPARRFSPSAQRLHREFVTDGGIFICTVGAEQAAASESLLNGFDIHIPTSPVPTGDARFEPEPMGRFRSVYLEATRQGGGEYQVGVRFHSGWPVVKRAEDGETLVRGTGNRPIVVARNIGQGAVVVVGDSEFAMNKNLEYIGGEPFDGRYENAEFWRWLIAKLTDRPEWTPPPTTDDNSDPENADEAAPTEETRAGTPDNDISPDNGTAPDDRAGADAPADAQ